MSQPLANLVLPIVSEELENLLYTYSSARETQASSPSEFRQELQNYVLKRVPACYARVEESSDIQTYLNLVPRLLHQQIKAAILDGIQQLAIEHQQWSNDELTYSFSAHFATCN